MPLADAYNADALYALGHLDSCAVCDTYADAIAHRDLHADIAADSYPDPLCVCNPFTDDDPACPNCHPGAHP